MFIRKSAYWMLAGLLASATLMAEEIPAPTTPAAPANSAPVAPATVTEKAEKPAEAAEKDATEKDAAKKKDKGKKKKMTVADDKEDPPPPEKDPATYELSNRKMIEDYTEIERRPYDRGEHILISGLFGAFGGGVIGGLVGLTQYDKDNTTTTQNGLYAFGGAGAGVGLVAGITVTFFERGKIEQFAIGKFLMKYSWYGAFGGALIGAGIGFLPYSSSNNESDIFRYAGYGAGAGFAASLVLFFIDLPDHLKLYSYRRDDQNVVMLALRF